MGLHLTPCQKKIFDNILAGCRLFEVRCDDGVNRFKLRKSDGATFVKLVEIDFYGVDLFFIPREWLNNEREWVVRSGIDLSSGQKKIRGFMKYK